MRCPQCNGCCRCEQEDQNYDNYTCMFVTNGKVTGMKTTMTLDDFKKQVRNLLDEVLNVSVQWNKNKTSCVVEFHDENIDDNGKSEPVVGFYYIHRNYWG